MSRTLTGERQPASERDKDFGGHQRERIQQEGPWRLGLSQRVVPGSSPLCMQADSKRADSQRFAGWDRAIRTGSA